MLLLDSLNVTVKINLNNGIYQFDCESSTGKTRLYKVLRDYQRCGVNVISYSYNDLIDGLDLRNILLNKNPDLILLDRYDMYNTLYHKELISLESSCIVLIDSKEMLKFGEYDLVCGINLLPESIEVYG